MVLFQRAFSGPRWSESAGNTYSKWRRISVFWNLFLVHYCPPFFAFWGCLIKILLVQAAQLVIHLSSASYWDLQKLNPWLGTGWILSLSYTWRGGYTVSNCHKTAVIPGAVGGPLMGCVSLASASDDNCWGGLCHLAWQQIKGATI